MAIDDFKLKLEGTISKQVVTFDTMPALYENNAAVYQTLNPPHLIGDYKVYDHSNSRSFDVSEIKLVSRNQREARYNLQKILTLKGWTKSYFGDVTGNQELADWMGAPPEVLYFSAYAGADRRGLVTRVPVVLEKVGISYPNDCDYIPTAFLTEDDELGGIPFPLITNVSINLTEQHSPYEYETFNLDLYRKGLLVAF